MVGPAFSQSSNNAGKFAFLVSLVSSESASHCKENNINYSNNLLLVRIKNTPCFYFEKKKEKKGRVAYIDFVDINDQVVIFYFAETEIIIKEANIHECNLLISHISHI